MPNIGKKVTIFLWILSFSIISFSQTLPFRNYLKENGLPHAFISTIFQDSHGYLWFGTADGFSRFDGIEFKSYKKEDGLSSTFILALLEDTRKRIWIGTLRGGLNCLSSGQFTNYTTAHGLASDSIRAIAQDKKGFLWLGTEKGLCRFNGKNFKTFTSAEGLCSNNITHIANDSQGKVWITTTNGVNCFSTNLLKKDIITYTTANGLIHNTALTLLHDSKGNTWIGTEGGLNCLKDNKFTSFTIKDGLINNYISTLYEDTCGNIWIGTLGGISIFSQGTFTNFSSKNGLPYNFIHKIIQDQEGNYWFATSSGASCLKSLNIKTYSEKDGLIDNVIKTITEDKKGRYWIATGDGLSCFSKGSFKNYTRKDGLISHSINDLIVDRQGKIWITTPEGLSILSPNSGIFKNFTCANGLPDSVLFSLIESQDRTIWIGSRKGVFRYSGGKFSPSPFNLPRLVSRLIEDSQGNIWFATVHGVFRYSQKTFQLSRYTTDHGLPSNTIRTLFEDSKHRIWIGTENGLSIYSYSNKKKEGKFTHFTPGNELPFQECFSIQEDKRGNLWFATANGLVCYNNNTFKSYNRKHGMPTDTYFSTFVDKKDTLWLGSAFGLIEFTPPIITNSVPPPVYITSVKVLEKETPLSKIELLKYNENYIRIGFTGICFTSPESVRYKYQLAGIDTNWMDTNYRSLFYPYLPSGTYTFRVKAINNDGIESIKPDSITFTILPPFWKTWWFQTLLFVTVLLIFLFVGFRIHEQAKEKLLAKARTRQLIISQRLELMGLLAGSAVHDLKNLLSIIIGYSEIVSEKFHPDDRTGAEIYRHNENIKITATTAVQVVKQILSFAKQKYNENESVNISELLNQILEILKVTTSGDIKFHWSLPEEEIYYPIHPIRFQQLVMNLCINAVQAMPEGGDLKISLSKKNKQQIQLDISDTGCGIDKESLKFIFDPLFTTKEDGKGTGLGLFVVKQIIEEYGSEIEVNSLPGKGTTFTIIFPIQSSNMHTKLK